MDETATKVQVTLLFFAKAHELTGIKECNIFFPSKLSFIELLDKITRTFKLEAIRNQIILAVNEEFVTPNSTVVLSKGDKIAVIPPLSGGLYSINRLEQLRQCFAFLVSQRDYQSHIV